MDMSCLYQRILFVLLVTRCMEKSLCFLINLFCKFKIEKSQFFNKKKINLRTNLKDNLYYPTTEMLEKKKKMFCNRQEKCPKNIFVIFW